MSAATTRRGLAGLAGSIIGAHRRRLDRELDRLLDLKSTDVKGSHLRAAIAVTASDKLLVFLTRRDRRGDQQQQRARPAALGSSAERRTGSAGMGANVYADFCSVVATGLAGRTALAAIRDALAAPVPEQTAA
jgi:hypothetical protein